MINLLNKYARG